MPWDIATGQRLLKNLNKYPQTTPEIAVIIKKNIPKLTGRIIKI